MIAIEIFLPFRTHPIRELETDPDGQVQNLRELRLSVIYTVTNFFFYYKTHFKTFLSYDTFNLNFSIIVLISVIIL